MRARCVNGIGAQRAGFALPGNGIGGQFVRLPSENSSRAFVERCRHLAKALKPLLRKLDVPLPGTPVSDDSRWLHDNVYLLISEFEGASETLKLKRKTPHVRTPGGAVVPRVAALAEGFLVATAYQFSEK